ncbi:MAG TPA: hypothetical protein VNF73_12350 [Candidatus Saccharimonadales bacterium]|nr:hypothetical protein [Candidatus Saccharimonadales bacterium]
MPDDRPDDPPTGAADERHRGPRRGDHNDHAAGDPPAADAADIPEGILRLAEARRSARIARDWEQADRLKEQVEAGGWKVVDDGMRFRLTCANPPDLVEERRTRYGASQNVPSRLDDAPVGIASVVLIATDWPDDLERALASMAAEVAADIEVNVVANEPSREQETLLLAWEARETAERDAAGSARAHSGLPDTIVWTSRRLGHAAALNVGLRTVRSPIAIVLDPGMEAVGDFVTPLARALEDPSVAVAGGAGWTSRDLRHFEEATSGDVSAVAGTAMAFRRTDFAARGPLDEQFRIDRNLDLWWSLVLRDEGDARSPRRAIAMELPLVAHPRHEWSPDPTASSDRLGRRGFYRVLDRFGGRRDLAVGPA